MFIQMRSTEDKTYTAQQYAELETKIAELEHDKPVTSLQVRDEQYNLYMSI